MLKSIEEIKHDIVRNTISKFEVETLLSAISWDKFLEQNRGYLYLPENMDIEMISENSFEYKEDSIELEQITYFQKGDERYNNVKKLDIAEGKSEECREFYKLVNTYNPKTQFLIVVGLNRYKENASEHFFLKTPKVPPEIAFHKMFGNQKLYDDTSLN